MSWTSPLIARNGNCCGTVAPDKCLEFVITLHPNATSVNFQISSGAVPPGALYYQVNCGPQIPVGSPICLTGAGPHLLTFCKPGNNDNGFTITSYSAPTFGPDLVLNNGCSGILTSNYYDESTVTWTSISPGATGQYNNNLSCLNGCDTTTFTSSIGIPDTVLYQVCGYDINGCIINPICHVFTVTNIPAPTTNLPADTIMICPGDSNIWVNANPISTSGPYNLSWSNGTTSDSVLLSPGWHYVTISDASNCLSQIDSILVLQNLLTTQAQAGPDQILCQTSTINLSGTVTNGQNPYWWGGNGIFSNANTSNTSYSPTAIDQANGSIQLMFSIDGFNNCPGKIDTLEIFFAQINPNFNIQTSDISCFGAQDGSVSITNLDPLWQPYQFSLNNGIQQSTGSFNNLSPGNHQLTISNSQGCDTTLTFSISEPNLLTLNLNNLVNVSCYGFSNGQLHLNAQGGTTSYQYNWLSPAPSNPNSPSIQNLPIGTYTCVVTDLSGCSATISETISQPTQLTLLTNYSEPLCHSDSTLVNLMVSGGITPYSFTMNGLPIQSSTTLFGGYYNVQVTDSNNCLVIDNFTINQPTPIQVQLPPDTVVCSNMPITLYTQTNGGTPNYNYNWSINPTLNSSAITFLPNSMNNVTVTVIDQNNCSQTTSVLVNVFTTTNDHFNLSEESATLCNGDSIQVDYTYTCTAPIASVLWMDCQSCGFPRYITATSNTMYVAQLTTICGDILYDTLFVQIHIEPIGAISMQDTTACYGAEVQFIYSPINPIGYQFLWEFSDGQYSTLPNPVMIFNSPGFQTVNLTLINSFGCIYSVPANSQLFVYNQVIADFNALPSPLNIFEPTVNLTNTSINAISYWWDFNDGNTSTLTNPSHTYNEPLNFYTITLYSTSVNGCMDSITKDIPVKPDYALYVPNAFTPDANEFNNYFSVKGYNVSEENFFVNIYDRWGHEVFASNDFNFQWDGTISSTQIIATQGVYTWTILFQDEFMKRKRISGHVNLLR
jgi:gliding motility-associated-like protein